MIINNYSNYKNIKFKMLKVSQKLIEIININVQIFLFTN